MTMQGRFDEFVKALRLKQAQVDRMEQARITLETYLRSSYALPMSAVFLQGSYANGTCINPIDHGEYDLDIICVCATATDSCNAALNDLERVLRANGNYANRIKRKNRAFASSLPRMRQENSTSMSYPHVLQATSCRRCRHRVGIPVGGIRHRGSTHPGARARVRSTRAP